MTWAVIVAMCALAFTVASFWWLHARRGHLESYEPHSFAASLVGSLRIRLPLVLYNTGAVPIVVQSIRLRVGEEPPLTWITTRSQLRPTKEDEHRFAAPFPVSGRSAKQVFVEFGKDGSLEAKDHEVQVEVKLGHKKDWILLLAFTLRTGQVKHSKYITYSNDPEVISIFS
ncbi:hypothetical protein [Spirillospora sp. CA-128828]|uniref:hypothetical protein n=1 Tax=Spirillospora sp. CA-128828 TaxID=3240033 RepID=UPI003D93EA5D